MAFYPPIAAPFDAATYPVASAYDCSDTGTPANWRLAATVEGASVQIVAACSGYLSALPPNEIPPSDYGLISTPDGTYAHELRLYLVPDQPADILPSSGGSRVLEVANLGAELRWFVYDNVDAAALSADVLTAIRTHPSLTSSSRGTLVSTDDKKLEAFAEGEVQVRVAAGAVIGQASTVGATRAGFQRLEFGVFTTNGYVDAGAFFDAVAAQSGSAADTASFADLVGGTWPKISASTAAALITSAASAIYPAGVLLEAKSRLTLSDADWRSVGDAQKALYWAQLLVRHGASGMAASFTFNTDDMVNPFQLEAVVEFYLWWPTPAVTAMPASTTMPNPAQADLLTSTAPAEANSDGPWFHLVLIDPFNDTRLGGPTLPGPNFRMSSYTETGGACGNAPMYESSTARTYPADDYDGVMFVVHRGIVVNWFRWSSISSHVWGDSAGVTRFEGSCAMGGSAHGNIKYTFTAYRSGKEGINFAFRVLYDDPATAAYDPLSTGLPARYYSRAGTSLTGQQNVAVHRGYAGHGSDSSVYSGSGGCHVSPMFFAFRNDLIARYQKDSLVSADDSAGVERVRVCTTAALNTALYNISDPQKRDAAGFYDDTLWNYKIQGYYWLIHPDEYSEK